MTEEAGLPHGFTVTCVAADPMGSCVTSCTSFRTGGLACSPWARVQCSGCGKEEPTNTHLATCEDLRRRLSEPVEFSRIEHDHPTSAVCRRTCPAYSEALMEKTAARFDVPQTQNDRGEWVPAIPEPDFLIFGRTRCECGEKFRGRARYREHYALAHILGLS